MTTALEEMVAPLTPSISAAAPRGDVPYDRTVDTHIKTLRAKLRAINPDLSPINTSTGAMRQSRCLWKHYAA